MRAGIPEGARGKVWQLLLDSSPFCEKNRDLFQLLQKSNEDIEYSIRKDLARTFPFHPQFSNPNSLG